MRAGSSVEVLIALAGLLLACGCQRSATPVSSLRAASTSPSVERPQPQTSADDAANVVRAYYRAIDERRYGDAYRQWASDGAASGKSFEAFRDGFASTATVDVAPGPPGPIEGAAGSRYVEIPVRLTAVARDGTRQTFVGTYTLRRSVVDGATPAQRAWRIHSARIRVDRP